MNFFRFSVLTSSMTPSSVMTRETGRRLQIGGSLRETDLAAGVGDIEKELVVVTQQRITVAHRGT